MGTLIFSIYEEFLELVKIFAECKYDAIDSDDKVYLTMLTDILQLLDIAAFTTTEKDSDLNLILADI